MTEDQFKSRTRDFALDVIRFVEGLDRDVVTAHIGRQILRCGTSVGANYRAACRARSNAEMVAKLGIVVEEADETLFWLDLLKASNRGGSNVPEIEKEADELLRMTVSSVMTLKGLRSSRNQQSKIENLKSK